MSLDISADSLVTALPPFPSLIQRLGRLNRRAGGSDPGEVGRVCTCLVYDFSCREGMPYKPDELALAARPFVDFWGDRLPRPISRSASPRCRTFGESQDYGYSAWLDGGWESRPATAPRRGKFDHRASGKRYPGNQEATPGAAAELPKRCGLDDTDADAVAGSVRGPVRRIPRRWRQVSWIQSRDRRKMESMSLNYAD